MDVYRGMSTVGKPPTNFWLGRLFTLNHAWPSIASLTTLRETSSPFSNGQNLGPLKFIQEYLR